MLLTRNSAGQILDNGNPIVLRGAHCHAFSKVAGERGLEQNGKDFYVTFPTEGGRSNGCAATVAESGLAIASWGQSELYLDRLQAAECNLARVFLSNGTEFNADGSLATLHPFVRQGRKWQVAAAIRDKVEAAWSAPFFAALTRLARAADQRGIALQLCLFSHHDFFDTDEPTFKYWPASFWNAKNADDTSWADNNLVPTSEGTNPSNLNRAFMEVGNYRRLAVQRAYVERVLRAIAGSGNVILELMNEPRVGDENGHRFMVNWLSAVTGWIREWLQASGTTPRPLISVNASYPKNGILPPTPGGNPQSDADFWAGSGVANYGQIDIVSYHGLTGIGAVPSLCRLNPEDPESEGLPAPQTDPAAIRARIAVHKTRHPGKALMLSTDAVRFGAQNFQLPAGALFEAQRRDGVVRTSVDPEAALSPQEQVTRFDLDNWAYHTFKEGLKTADRGRVHFQNHSTWERSFGPVRSAWRAASGLPPVPANDGFWRAAVTRVSGGANHQNFWWEHRHLADFGQLVNQLHTENAAGSAAAATGESEIGWRYELVAAGGPLRLSAAYDLIAVSEIEDPLATVEQRLRLVAAPLAGGAPLVAERLLQRGQHGAGQLELAITATAGQAWAVTLTSLATIRYQNRTRVAYGETIVRFVHLMVS